MKYLRYGIVLLLFLIFSSSPLRLLAQQPGSVAAAIAANEQRYAEAWSAYDKEDYDTAIDLATELADSEDYRGHFLLGTMLFRGHGAPQDTERGAALIHASAAQGYAHAQLAVAAIFHRGMIDGQPDLVNAMPWYIKAAEQGIPQAQTMIGIHYYRGELFNKDMEKARGWLMMAAAQRYDAALLALAQINLEQAPERSLQWMLVMRRINNEYLTQYASENMGRVLSQVTNDQIMTASQQANQWVEQFIPDALPATDAGFN